MRELQLRDAKATLSSVVQELVVGGEAVTITRHGRPAAVVVSYDEWKRLSNVPSFGRLLGAGELCDGDIERDRKPLRDVDL